MAIVAYCILWAAGGNDLIATHFNLSINDLTWLFRIGVFVFPPLAFVITKRICLGLQRKDRDLVLHGHETGQVVRTADGEFFEVHAPLDEYDRWTLVQHESLPSARARAPRSTSTASAARAPAPERRRAKLSRFFFEHRVEPVTPAELAAAHHGHGDHEAIEGGHDEAVEAKGHGHQSIGS